MNSVHPMHMDPRCVPLGMVRTPGMMMPPIIARHQLVRHGVVGRGMPHPGMGGPGPPPMQGQNMAMPGQNMPMPGQNMALPGQNIYVEDQMDHLAGKLDMLENELRYAWRALDVLSQEYIKMWERMEKLEGLLTEQQTVITQLIDLYTADSSDNAENEFDSNGRDISNFSNFGGKAPDESFYKALNMVHQNSYPEPQLPQMTNFNTANVDKSPKSTKNQQQGKGPRQTDYIENYNLLQSGQNNGGKISNQVIREDSDGDLKSMSSSMRSTHSGFSDVAEFPVPADTSPTYENLMSGGTLVTSVANNAAPKRKLPQLPADNRRTRKDGYVGADQRSDSRTSSDPRHDNGLSGSTQSVTNVFTSAGAVNTQNEISYDTYPRRKKKKDKQAKKKETEDGAAAGESPLTVIDGNYSFNISSEKSDQTRSQPPRQQQQVQKPSEAGQMMGQPKDLSGGAAMTKPKTQPDATGQQQVKVGVQGKGLGPQQQQQQTSSKAEDTPSDNSLTRASANSLFQQIHEHGGITSNKGRKLSLKEKRKLRAERDLTEFLPKSVEVEEPPNQAPVLKRPDHSNSESDVSMRSDISPKRDSDDVDQMLAGNGVPLMDHARQRSLLQPQQQPNNKPNSREFAVSRALGKYRSQKKKERESSNSDSQDELEIESTLKSLDAKLAEIEESVEPDRSISVSDASKAIPMDKVQSQLNKFEEAGVKPIEAAKSPRQMSRKISEDSNIDTEDEWYKHEMMRLKRLEAEQSAGAAMGSVIGELNKKLVGGGKTVQSQDISKVGQPPDRPPGEPPDKGKVTRRSSRKQLLRKSTASEKSTEDDNDESSVTGSADDDSDTQSGEDYIEDEEDYAVVKKPSEAEAAKQRPGNLIIIQPQSQQVLPNKPDLLEELTAAAAEDHYPEHLKNGEYGEDGVWYDEHGETGYWGEDGEWYDYMDEIGYYSDGGEWHEYDYSTGYWDDEGEWKLKSEAPPASNATVAEPGKSADHFLWVSEEGTNEFANDQVPSSELTTAMVIGKPVSGSTETSHGYCHQHHLDNNLNNNITNEYSEPEEVLTIIETETDHIDPQVIIRNKPEDLPEDEDYQDVGGGRWGAIMRRHEILLVSHHKF